MPIAAVATTQEADGPSAGGVREGEDAGRESILLAACGAGEVLPQNPDLPADVFTACLTTPIKARMGRARQPAPGGKTHL